jgi:hypothetical protein
MIFAYTLILITLSLYSFALIDPNLTLINHELWEAFRNTMVNFGYHNRVLSSWAFCFFVNAIVGFSLFYGV